MGVIERIIVDDATMSQLEADARRHGRSVGDEAAERLRASTARLSREQAIAELDAIAAMTPKNIKQTDSTLLIRDDRDR